MENRKLVAITGNTYPVKEALKALGAKWNPEKKAWMVVPTLATKAQEIVAGKAGAPRHAMATCTSCGVRASNGTGFGRNRSGAVNINSYGLCQECGTNRYEGNEN